MIENLNKTAIVFSLIFALGISGLSYGAPFYAQEEKATIQVYEKVNPSIVAVDGEMLLDNVSSGSGIIIDPTGIILTSSHVIDDTRKITVTFSNNEKTTAKVLAIMGDLNDLAILKVNVNRPLKAIKLGDSTHVKVGQRVLAVGNPFGFNGTLTTGIISRIDYDRNRIQTDAAINPGSSGGPLINMDGEVIGINQSIYNPDNNQSNIGIGFAVPVNTAKRMVNDFKNDRKFAVNIRENFN
ncbi:MAG: trypsin-like peptidase domain-containing protein [Candidatus Gastranaerophilales bacterium]|nr:trypsin-like peptidase domain-containing protein [Candidatus Gastranaerophilales bacterium]